MPFPQGALVGSYEIVAPLGSGGMGEVYRARDPRLGRDVALKVLRAASGDHEDVLDRLLREATLASALNHPNIVTIYETGVIATTDDGHADAAAKADRYIAMELVEGTTLRKLVAEGLALGRALAIARQVAEALAVAHAAGIVHRDIKPDNVMVRPDGYVKLLDFGLARVHTAATNADPTGTVTGAGMIIGTVGYMSPEQARGESTAPEADVFAFGVLLYELLTGRHPFLAASQLATLHAVMWEAPEPLSLINPEVPRPLEQLVLEMMQKDARLRPGAGEVLYRLALWHDSSVALALSEVSVPQRTSAPKGSLVARDIEMDALLHEFDRADRGHGRVVTVSAEAGMGKTTLVDAFIRTLAERGTAVRIGRGRCSERLAGSEAYLPVLEALDSLQHSEQLGSISRLIRGLAPSWYAQIIPASGHDSSAARLAAETALGSQERLKREIAALLEEAARLQPMVLFFDDVQWADPSTTDLIGYLARRLDDMRVLIVATCRPSELAQARHPFLSLKLDLVARGLGREVTLGGFDRAAIRRYLALQFPEHTFPEGLGDVIHERTEGHPLFVVDLVRDLRRRQVIRQQDGRWVVTADLASLARELPESMRSLVQRKIDAVDEDDRKLLAAATVQGIDFDTAVVAAAAGRAAEEVEDRLERIEREHALVQFVDEWEAPDRSLTLRYRFTHHVYQNALYDSVRATRRVALARAIADTLVGRVGDEPCDCAADVALLLETAREPLRAADYWNRAAQAAARLYAHDDTTRLARRGLDLLSAEPDSAARAAVELDLQMTLGLSIKTSRGYAVPEVFTAYARARELCRRVNDPARVVPVLIGLSAHHIVSGEIETSRDIGLEMLDLFNRLGDPHLQMLGNWSLGTALFHLGELEVAHDHLQLALDLYDPAFHQPRVWETGIDPGVFCRCELSRTLTLRGLPDQGLACAEEAVAQARALGHPQVLAFALLFLTFAHLARRDPHAVLATYDELASVCRAHGIAQELQWAAPLRGRALVELGQVEQGLYDVAEGLEAHTLTRSALLRPYYFVLFAGALLRARRLDAAQQALDESRRVAEATSQRAYDSEHRRLQAEVLVARGDMAAAERAFMESLEIARGQNARWFELRAARGYANFLVVVGRLDEARALLQPVLGSVTEGLNTIDYVYTDALLQSCRL